LVHDAMNKNTAATGSSFTISINLFIVILLVKEY
jgi:hypothetical protein